MKSTLHLSAQGIHPPDTWTTVITKLRIHHEPNSGNMVGGRDHPWVLDGFNENTLELTEDVEYHPTFEAVIADLEAFVRRYNLEWASPLRLPVEELAADSTAHYWGDLGSLEAELNDRDVTVEQVIATVTAGIRYALRHG